MKAINYNPSAKSENGTCLYCNSIHQKDSVLTQGFYFVPDSGQDVEVADINVFQLSTFNQGNGCVSIGRGSDSICKINLAFINKSAYTISGNYSLEITSFQTSITTFRDNRSFSQVHPNDTIYFDNVDSNCTSILNGSSSLSLSNMSFSH